MIQIKDFLFCYIRMEKSKNQFDHSSDLNSLKDRTMHRSMMVIFNKESETIEKNLTLATAGFNCAIYWIVWNSLGNNE